MKISTLFKVTSISMMSLGFLFSNLTSGCASKDKAKTTGADSTTTDQALIDAQELEKIFLLEDNSLFETKKSLFFEKHPNSQYVQFVHLLSSKQYLKKNLYVEALATNQEVQNKTFTSNKEIYYLALFESADIYEAQELYDKSLAALVEAEKNKNYLPPRKRMFELPLKLSVAYSRLGLTDLTFKYLKATQDGLNEFLKTESLDNQALAKLYLEIGGGLSQWQSNDFNLELRKFVMTYKFLVYSMNRNEAAFSDKAQKKLISQLQWIWNLSQTQRSLPDSDRLEEEKAQFLKLTEFSKLLNSIKMYEPLEGQKKSPLQDEFFGFVEQVQDVVLEKIYAQYRYTPPTQESFRHNLFRDNLTIENMEIQK
jgi:hypothetical protein